MSLRIKGEVIFKLPKYIFSRSVTHKTKVLFILQATCFGLILNHRQAFSKKVVSIQKV
jgi:hypothetical protein